MKVSLVSDLHLELGYEELPGGEVLILAGDICEARSLRKDFHSTKVLDRKPGFLKCQDFFEFECAKYDKVFYVMGNHEHYGTKLHKTKRELESLLPSFIRVLEDEYEEYNGVLFLGSTLWTDCNKGNPITAMTLHSGMNDFRTITFYDEKNDSYHKLRPENIMAVHHKTKKYFQEVLSSNMDKPSVVITHHAPSFQSSQYHFSDMNGGYCSDMEEFILQFPQVKYWVHGHLHSCNNYKIGETSVISNCRGYVGHENVKGYNRNYYFEV